MTKPLSPRTTRELPELDPLLIWTDIPGTSLGVAASGVRKHGRDDLVVFRAPGNAAAVVTRSTAIAAPCRWTRERVPGRVHAIIVNSGNANAATGEQGERDVKTTALRAAELLDCSADEVLVCSTGVIGVPMPMEKVLSGLESAARDMTMSAERAAKAILTTDTTLKQAGCLHEGFRVAGIAKGSGMVHPDMGTMLGFLVTDAAVRPQELQDLLQRVTDRTFNAVTVDGDTSTSDTVILQATGTDEPLTPGLSSWRGFESAVEAVCRSLARSIAADGEGASRLISVLVEGLQTDEDAASAARAIASSNLVKCAVHGADANWGRVVGALGAHSIPDLDQLDLDIAGIPVLRCGQPIAFDESEAKRALSQDEVLIHAHLPGSGRGEAWGCDLTHGYVDINARYRS